MADQTVTARGYRRLPPATRGLIADIACGVAVVAAVAALFPPAKLEGVWLRLPVLCALIVALAGAWLTHRRLKVPPVARGGAFVALVGMALLAAALHSASGWASLAGGLSLVAAWLLRGSAEQLQIKGRDQRGPRTGLSLVFDQVESLAAALVVVLLVWHFALEAFRIPSGSMAPTLSGDPIWGDRVFVDKVVYEYRDPERWEPTVFRYPLKRSDPYVKRLIGLPGEQLMIAQGDIYIRRNPGAEIELLRKAPQAREVLWLPLLKGVKSPPQWVGNFVREGAVDFRDGTVRLGEGGVATYPKGAGDRPGEIVDHDASFGTTETPPQLFGHHVCGDVRLRARVSLAAGGEFACVIQRDGERYTLTLREDGMALARLGDDGEGREFAAAQAANAGRRLEVAFSLADGLLRAEVDGQVLEHDVGSPLLDALRNRDRQKPLSLAAPEAIGLAGAEPPGGRRARVELRAVKGTTELRVDGIDRDIYYIGRKLPEVNAPAERPLGIELGDDHYFVLGDNSAGSKDARQWFQAILRMSDGTQVTGGLDDGGQELALMLAQTGAQNGGMSALQKLQRVALLAENERDIPGTDAQLVSQAVRELREFAQRSGRGAIDFNTQGGGYTRVVLSELETIQVRLVPYVERRLFVGRPFAVFLSPRGVKLIQ